MISNWEGLDPVSTWLSHKPAIVMLRGIFPLSKQVCAQVPGDRILLEVPFLKKRSKNKVLSTCSHEGSWGLLARNSVPVLRSLLNSPFSISTLPFVVKWSTITPSSPPSLYTVSGTLVAASQWPVKIHVYQGNAILPPWKSTGVLPFTSTGFQHSEKTSWILSIQKL